MRFLPFSSAADSMAAHVSTETVERHVSEGVLVARSALRLAIKNGVIMSTMRDARRWNTAEVTALAREAIDSLIAELSTTADRLEVDAATQPTRRFGARGRDMRLEVARLTLRARTARGVVERLRSVREDDDAITQLVEAARDDTLTELTKARLQTEHEFAHQSAEERRIAMEGVAADLLTLQKSRER